MNVDGRKGKPPGRGVSRFFWIAFRPEGARGTCTAINDVARERERRGAEIHEIKERRLTKERGEAKERTADSTKTIRSSLLLAKY